MNRVHFRCLDCRAFTDAGYRFAYWTLEHAGIVARDRPVDPVAVLGATEYWKDESDWITRDIHPHVREFLSEHGAHHLLYGEFGYSSGAVSDDELLLWIETGAHAEPTPRQLRDSLGLRAWSQVEAWMQAHPKAVPWWWEEEDVRALARTHFHHDEES